MTFLTNEFSIDLPEVSMDRTVNVLTINDPERNTPFQIIINRDMLLAEETLKQCCERQVGLITRQAKSFKTVSQKTGFVGAAQTEAILIESSFSQAGKTYFQLQAMFVTEAPKLMVLTLSSHVPLHPGHRDTWNKTLQSLQPRPAQA